MLLQGAFVSVFTAIRDIWRLFEQISNTFFVFVTMRSTATAITTRFGFFKSAAIENTELLAIKSLGTVIKRTAIRAFLLYYNMFFDLV